MTNITELIIKKYYQLCLDNKDNLISSLTLGEYDFYDFKEENYKCNGYLPGQEFSGIKINISYKKKRLIKFNLRLTLQQKRERMAKKFGIKLVRFENTIKYG